MVSKYTTVEKGEPNWWWVWSNGNYLKTSEVVTLLNKQDELIKDLYETNHDAVNALLNERNEVLKLEYENEKLKNMLSNLINYLEIENDNKFFGVEMSINGKKIL